jgi:hypothetical protein
MLKESVAMVLGCIELNEVLGVSFVDDRRSCDRGGAVSGGRRREAEVIGDDAVVWLAHVSGKF